MNGSDFAFLGIVAVIAWLIHLTIAARRTASARRGIRRARWALASGGRDAVQVCTAALEDAKTAYGAWSPACAPYWGFLAQAYAAACHFDAAGVCWREVLKLAPKDAAYWDWVVAAAAALAEEEGNPTEARRVLEIADDTAAAARVEVTATLWRARAFTARTEGRFADAIAAAEQALAAPRRNASGGPYRSEATDELVRTASDDDAVMQLLIAELAILTARSATARPHWRAGLERFEAGRDRERVFRAAWRAACTCSGHGPCGEAESMLRALHARLGDDARGPYVQLELLRVAVRAERDADALREARRLVDALTDETGHQVELRARTRALVGMLELDVDRETALESLRRAREESPSDVRDWPFDEAYAFANVLLRAGMGAVARAVVDDRVAALPTEWAAAAMWHATRGELGRASEIVGAAVGDDAELRRAASLEATLLAEKGDFVAARARVQDGVRGAVGAELGNALIGAGWIELLAGDHDAGAKWYEAAAEALHGPGASMRQRASALNGLAECRLASGAIEAAATALHAVDECYEAEPPMDFRAWRFITRSQMERARGDVGAAVESASRARVWASRTLGGADEWAEEAYARALLAGHRHDEARTVIEEGLAAVTARRGADHPRTRVWRELAALLGASGVQRQ